MTIRDMYEAGITFQGNVTIDRYDEDGNLCYSKIDMTGELWPDDSHVYDIEVAYIYSKMLDGCMGICIELEAI